MQRLIDLNLEAQNTLLTSLPHWTGQGGTKLLPHVTTRGRQRPSLIHRHRITFTQPESDMEIWSSGAGDIDLTVTFLKAETTPGRLRT